jgi:hypothetical protein
MAFNIDILANSSALDRLIDWKLHSPGNLRRTGNRMSAITEGKHMQRQFTIELRVDYEDSGKNDEMRKACAAAARHVYATASLLAEGVKPQISVYSDDYFAGHEEIKMLEDTIQQGLDSIGSDETSVSSELMAAVRDA